MNFDAIDCFEQLTINHESLAADRNRRLDDGLDFESAEETISIV